MSKEGWVHMELPYHQNQFLRLLKKKKGKKNMAQVVELLMQHYDGNLLEKSIKMAQMAELYEQVENGNGDE